MTTKEEVISELEYLTEDEDLPASVMETVTDILKEFRETDELSLTVNKAINELEDLTEDVNIPTFVRTQLWGVMSSLTELESEISS